MRNRSVGLLIIGIAGLIGFIVYLFNKALVDIVNATCTHGEECTMWQTIEVQSMIGIGIIVFVVFIGIYLILWGDRAKEKAVEEPQKPLKDFSELTKDLLDEEKKV